MTSARAPMADCIACRMPRAGLGNMLFPWARAVCLSDELGIPLLPVSWFKFRLGPFLRAETDSRQYQSMFESGRPRARLAARVRLAVGPVLDEEMHRIRPGVGPTVMVVSGLGQHFQPLYGHQSLIVKRFREMLRSPGEMPSGARPYVAVHVRLGDFARPALDTPPDAHNRSTEVQWFVRQVQRRAAQAPGTRFVVCSDGRNDEIADLLQLPAVCRSTARNPAEDLLLMAGAEHIFGSGSTFSAWGCFLGGVPLSVEPGKNHYLEGDPLVTEVE